MKKATTITCVVLILLGLLLCLASPIGIIFIAIGIGLLWVTRKKKVREVSRQRSGSKNTSNVINTIQNKMANETFKSNLEAIPKHDISINGSCQKLELSNMPEIKTTNVTVRSNVVNDGNFVVVDTETTGIDPYKHRIVELTAILFHNWEPVELFSTLINPKVKIPKEASAVSGIYDNDVKDSPTIDSVMNDFIGFVGSNDIVGHNVRFDLKFLYRAGFNFSLPKSRKIYDTLEIAKYTLSSPNTKEWDNKAKSYNLVDSWDVDDYKLTTLCDYYHIRDNSSAHRSDSDAYATALLFSELIEDKVNK